MLESPLAALITSGSSPNAKYTGTYGKVIFLVLRAFSTNAFVSSLITIMQQTPHSISSSSQYAKYTPAQNFILLYIF